MIVTRSWLEEYIDLSGISNQELAKRLNEIGLEVDSITEHNIPAKVVVGEVKSCQKHPDADKLNVCQVDIGSEVVQIVCGASNVVNAKYVAVATVGAVLPGDFKIKKAKLRGVESFGMICSSSELGLPDVEDGIMILDDSIGKLEVGKELNEYPKFADFVIEIELTANRGDCLSIHGVARDLAAAFKRELKDYKQTKNSNFEIDSVLSVELKDSFDGALEYLVADISECNIEFLTKLRVAFANLEPKSEIDTILAYAMHASGVLFRAYDYSKVADKDLAKLVVQKSSDYVVEVVSSSNRLSVVGVNIEDNYKAKECKKVIIEASYIEPEFVVEGVLQNKLTTDELYYNSSRGSEPDLDFGIAHLLNCLDANSSASVSSTLKIGNISSQRAIELSVAEIVSIIGQEISKDEITQILRLLKFDIKESGDKLIIEVPKAKSDIKNSYDIAEEILRIYGIDNIEARALKFEEKNRINNTYLKIKEKQLLSQRAVAAGFFEAMTYAFGSKEQQQKYGFDVLEDELDLLNPIVNELNTLRSTIVINLLNAAKQNVKYGKKSIPLFEVGSIFNSKREESEAVSFIYSGELERAGVKNSAKSKKIDFVSFVERIGAVIGEFELVKTEPKNALMHPYQSANVIKDGKEVGYIAKLHPKAAKDFGLSDTFIAEFELNSILPKHKNAKALSNYQPTTKDLSVVIDKSLNFYEVAKVLVKLKDELELLKDYYPLDIYSDESLGQKKSLTIRFTLQSDKKTLVDEDIEESMNRILNSLKESFGAELR
jgi:phenylalanyl-tRNA synthetase beta chain